MPKKAKTKAAKAAKPAKTRAKASKRVVQPKNRALNVNGRLETKADRRAAKLRRRQEEKHAITPAMWAEPAPAHLVAQLEKPKVKSKYQSYYEFADNPGKKDKKLEFKVISANVPPSPGYAFVPVGDPAMTSTCKELSREQDAMVFIVSAQQHNARTSEISEHVHRMGYHFRESIIEQAREIVGETIISRPLINGYIEPIPDTQEEINQQADSALRDLFPKIPNTDRTQIIEHAFKKGGLFHGEPTVGLQPTIPLSRRVQLAVLAHIRHTHTRYDKLLRETTWLNARKAVEPLCLDFILKWRGDDETGRDQIDEILREVVIITDSESEDESSDEEEDSDDDSDVTSESSAEPTSRTVPLSGQPSVTAGSFLSRPIDAAQNVRTTQGQTAGATPVEVRPRADKRAQRGFKRYQAAYDEAVSRRNDPAAAHTASAVGVPVHNHTRPLTAIVPSNDGPYHVHGSSASRYPSNAYIQRNDHQVQSFNEPLVYKKLSEAPQLRSPVPSTYRHEPLTRTHAEQASRPNEQSHFRPQPYSTAPSQVMNESLFKHHLQDMLVESVETPWSDVSPRRIEQRYDMPDLPGTAQGFQAGRLIDRHQQSKSHPNVIVIEDDSPVHKRRRMVDVPVSNHNRPVHLLDTTLHAADPDYDSSLAYMPPTQFRSLPTQHHVVPFQGSQGLGRDMRNTYTDPLTSEKLPIYDAPHSGYTHLHDGFVRRKDEAQSLSLQEVEYDSRPAYSAQPFRSGQAPSSLRPNGRSYLYEGDGAQYNRDQFHVSGSSDRYRARASPPSNRGHLSVTHGVEATSVPQSSLIHSFSQSRIDGDAPIMRDGFTVISERPQTYPSQEDQRPIQYLSANASAASAPLRHGTRPIERSPSLHQVGYSRPQRHYDGVQRSLPEPQGRSWNPSHQPLPSDRHMPPTEIIYLD